MSIQLLTYQENQENAGDLPFPRKLKSSPDESDELEYFVQIFEAVNLTYRSASRRMELAPFLFSSWI
jgi:hypothetical protein